MSKTMRALVLERFREPLVLRELPKPRAGVGHVVVRVCASGITALDVKIIEGSADPARVRPPAVLGMELAGIVESVGAQVTGFETGDEVFGMTGGVGTLQGSLAEYAAVDAALLASKPANLTMREAAALPLNFITAWEGLVDRARLSAGQTVLIHGGAGGVGSMGIQIARSLGAQTFATGRSRNLDVIAACGATPIDYESTPVEEYVGSYTRGEGFNVVYDTAGGAVLDASFKAAHFNGGHVVSCLGWGTHSLAPLSFRAATYSGVFTLLPMLSGIGRLHHGDILREAKRLAEQGLLKARLDPRSFVFESVESAHNIQRSGERSGKLVVSIAEH